MSRALKEILDEYFAIARRNGVPRVPTTSNNAEESRFLDVSAALLSRIKSGKSRLTDGKVKQFAALASAGSSKHKERLAER